MGVSDGKWDRWDRKGCEDLSVRKRDLDWERFSISVDDPSVVDRGVSGKAIMQWSREVGA